jgi:pimeloyl-ACP methyl ester carboxylesterase
MTTTSQPATLAFERRGGGVPIVLLPGLTFDRRSWRPIVDLPAHGASPGSPCDLEDVAAHINRLLERLGVPDPIVVGHSMAGAVTMIYAASYPARGAVRVESPVNVAPCAETVQFLEPATATS